jgi:hypothetical protein
MGILKSITEWPGFTWAKTHEKILIIALCLGVFVHFYSKAASLWVTHEEHNYQAMKAQSDAAKQAQVVAEADRQQAILQSAQDHASMQAAITAAQAQNAALLKEMQARDKATQQQQQVDLHATIPELSSRFASLVPNTDPKDIVIAPDQKSVTVGTDTAEKTVAQLELVPTLQADVKTEQQVVKSTESELKATQVYSTTLEHEITIDGKDIDSLNKVIAADDKTCQAQVNVEKAKNKGSFLHGFKWGFITGAITGLVSGHWLHI